MGGEVDGIGLDHNRLPPDSAVAVEGCDVGAALWPQQPASEDSADILLILKATIPVLHNPGIPLVIYFFELINGGLLK